MRFLARSIISWSLLAGLQSWYPVVVCAEGSVPSIPAAVAERLSRGETQDLIVLFEDRAVEEEAAILRQRSRQIFDDDTILATRRARYRALKKSTSEAFPARDVEELRDYDHLPLSLTRFRNRDALDRLLADPRVRAVFENRPVYPHLAYSLPFIGQPTVAGAGFAGSGQTVAVIDTGIDYTLSTFGSCTIPGVPAGCKIAAAVDVNGINNRVTTANNHGTNVSGIVLGVAPGARIASFNALPGGSGSTSDVIAGINWAIANRSAYNIVAINMSLGDGTNNSAPCSDPLANLYVSAISSLRNVGIMPVASSGNDGFTNGIGSPACTPGIVSVGAVYDASWRSSPDQTKTFSYASCTETALATPDRITCFSNSSSFLTMLAPGAFITAAGIQMAGTSQAAPHVAGAVAVLRAAYPGETLGQTLAHLISGSVSITDIRNGISKPRLNLRSAIDATAPVVSVTAPANGSTLSGTVTVNASASDNINVGKVEFYLDGVLRSTGMMFPYGFNWDTTAFSNGSHTLSAKAYDTLGNVGQSGNVAVKVFNDLTAPTVSLTAPLTGSTVSGTITVSASASDNVGVVRVEFYLNGALKSICLAAPYIFNWDTTTGTDGSYTLLAMAYDAAGNVGQTGSSTVTVSQPEAVPALAPWSILLAVVFLAGISGRLKKRKSA